MAIRAADTADHSAEDDPIHNSYCAGDDRRESQHREPGRIYDPVVVRRRRIALRGIKR